MGHPLSIMLVCGIGASGRRSPGDADVEPPGRQDGLVPAGSELDVVEDPTAPADFVRVRLPRGRLGYVRLQEVAATAPSAAPAPAARPPDVNTNARGCVSSTAALAALALLVLTGALGLVLVRRAAPADAGVLVLVFCVGLGPLLLLTIGLYVAARGREERLVEEEAETERRQAAGGRRQDEAGVT